MRHLWLLALIAFGSSLFSGVLTLPEAHPGKPSVATTPAVGGNGGGTGGGVGGGETSTDYSEYDEEEPQRAPGNLAKSTAGPKLPLPYFDQPKVDMYVGDNGSSVKVDCPVKNYNAQHHAILWYKDNSAISNGNTLFSSVYGLDTNFTLTVPVAANATDGQKYSCHVMPPDVRREVTIHLGPEPSTPAPATTRPTPAAGSAPTGQDCGLWLVLFLAALQLAVRF
ncbi:uncharacterized protein LOC111081647 [Drosophila obscura]|uniref:uncharacterized protein LOC111081647 n=1 Tax=Drosophila obscura TaxID=7282 RepID=UPI001BB1DCA1|nr:uncharacterized protein LOC111081647 [Drosophila obscura]